MELSVSNTCSTRFTCNAAARKCRATSFLWSFYDYQLGHGCAGWLTATVRREPGLARRFFDRFEPVHAVTYFAPEARAALDGLGYEVSGWATSPPDRRRWAVPPEVVTAIFYNFAPERVAKALPAAWQIAGPDAALRARQESAVAALRRTVLSR